MRALRVLDTAFTYLEPPSLEALAGAPKAGRLPELTELYLGGNMFYCEESVNAFTRAALYLRGLRVLEI